MTSPNNTTTPSLISTNITLLNKNNTSTLETSPPSSPTVSLTKTAPSKPITFSNSFESGSNDNNDYNYDDDNGNDDDEYDNAFHMNYYNEEYK